MITSVAAAGINAGYGMSAANDKTGGVMALSDFGGKIITKGQCSLSDEEIIQKVAAINKREVVNGQNSYCTPGWWRLANQYISKASPDRVGIINSTLASLRGGLGMRFRPGMNLLNTIMGNFRMFRSRDVGANFINFKDSSGQLIATYDTTFGWLAYNTPAEEARTQAFIAIWDKARVRAAQEIAETNTVINLSLSGWSTDLSKGIPCDTAVLAAYGITMDAETGRPVVDKVKLQQMTGRQVMDTPTVRPEGEKGYTVPLRMFK